MSLPRFFVDTTLAVGDVLDMPSDVAHHALRVLRLREAQPIVLLNGRGGEFRSTLLFEGPSATARIDAFDPIERETPLAVTLIQALVAADKFDWIVEKAVELGVFRIVTAPMQRCTVRLDAARRARRLQHWRQIARAACCQCGRNRVPAIDFSESFDQALAAAVPELPRFILAPEATRPLTLAAGDRGATLIVGPEGGLSTEELFRAQRAGFLSARLGPRILRTETAGLAALASLQALGGDFAAPDR